MNIGVDYEGAVIVVCSKQTLPHDEDVTLWHIIRMFNFCMAEGVSNKPRQLIFAKVSFCENKDSNAFHLLYLSK